MSALGKKIVVISKKFDAIPRNLPRKLVRQNYWDNRAMNNKCDISETLNELMMENNISNQQVADSVGRSVTSIRGWRRNANKLELGSLVKLCNYFNCSVEYLLDRTEKKLSYIPHECPPFYEHFIMVMYESGFTRYSFTKETRFREGHLYCWRKGSEPTLSTLVELAALFSCTVDYLIGREQ